MPSPASGPLDALQAGRFPAAASDVPDSVAQPPDSVLPGLGAIEHQPSGRVQHQVPGSDIPDFTAPESALEVLDSPRARGPTCRSSRRPARARSGSPPLEQVVGATLGAHGQSIPPYGSITRSPTRKTKGSPALPFLGFGHQETDHPELCERLPHSQIGLVRSG